MIRFLKVLVFCVRLWIFGPLNEPPLSCLDHVGVSYPALIYVTPAQTGEQPPEWKWDISSVGLFLTLFQTEHYHCRYLLLDPDIPGVLWVYAV